MANLRTRRYSTTENTSTKIILFLNDKTDVKVNKVYYLLITTSSSKLSEETENKSKPKIK
jgi:hypothetical protein